MASSRVMPSASTSARAEKTLAGSPGSVNMEDLLFNFYADTPAPGRTAGEIASTVVDAEDKGGGGGNGEVAPPRGERRKTAEEVWKEISLERKVADEAEPVYKEESLGEITLEAFLAREGAVTEEEDRAAPVEVPVVGFVIEPSMADPYDQNQHLQVEGQISGLGAGAESGAGGRGKRRAVEDPEDRAAKQRHRRMIKNRESAARSRERKQAYILELETVVTKLEDENTRLLRELEEQEKRRFKQLMDKLIPVAEGRPPPRALRRVCSVRW